MILFYYKIYYLFYLIIIIFLLINSKNIYNIRIYKRYINLCKKLIKLYFQEKKVLKSPYFSICISLYNMERYIEASLLSILNQSFRDFAILLFSPYTEPETSIHKIISLLSCFSSNLSSWNILADKMAVKKIKTMHNTLIKTL